VVTTASASWAALPAGAAHSLELAHRSLLTGGLAVGSAIVDGAGAIVAGGRNRAYDPATGNDPLEATPLAHAEMNAMAGLATDAAIDGLTLWSTQQPCSMCRAAIDFIGIPTVVAIATDPSSPHERADEVLDDVWVVLATTMFLIGPFRRAGRHHPIIQANQTLEPESVALAELVATARHPLVEEGALRDTLTATWDELSTSAAQRRSRRAAAR
jgi:tRNA(Arg) A34 adenosine deaminase TadA